MALMGIMGAFVFAAQMINFQLPAMPGTSGHMVGAVLLAIMLGPQIQDTIQGPAAKELVGEWIIDSDARLRGTNRIKVNFDPNRKFIFTPTGSTFTVEGGEERLFGYWRYDYPENPKDSSDVGEGKMFMFVTDGLFKLKLDSTKGERLIMRSRWRETTLKR